MNGGCNRESSNSKFGRKVGSRAAASVEVRAGSGLVKAHSLWDSTSAYLSNDTAVLRNRLRRDGYLFLRGIIPYQPVREAYESLIKKLQQADTASLAIEGARLVSLSSGSQVKVGLLGRQDLAQSLPVAQVLESPVLASLAANLTEASSVKTTLYKWLRAVPHGGFTGLHTDRVFLGANSEQLLTMWLPLHSIGPSQGSMLVCSGSHRSRAFSSIRQSYGASNVGSDGTTSGWLTDDGAKLANILRSANSNGCSIDWRTALFQPGDVLVLDQDTLHMTARNEVKSFRISCDTRWQPASHSANPLLGKWKTVNLQADATVQPATHH